MNDDERPLWQVDDVLCVMISCCAGAELQLRRLAMVKDARGEVDSQVVLRELYPTKSDLYERARTLEGEYRARLLR